MIVRVLRRHDLQSLLLLYPWQWFMVIVCILSLTLFVDKIAEMVNVVNVSNLNTDFKYSFRCPLWSFPGHPTSVGLAFVTPELKFWFVSRKGKLKLNSIGMQFIWYDKNIKNKIKRTRMHAHEHARTHTHIQNTRTKINPGTQTQPNDSSKWGKRSQWICYFCNFYTTSLARCNNVYGNNIVLLICLVLTWFCIFEQLR